jgi:hypothetical protein
MEGSWLERFLAVKTQDEDEDQDQEQQIHTPWNAHSECLCGNRERAERLLNPCLNDERKNPSFMDRNRKKVTVWKDS